MRTAILISFAMLGVVLISCQQDFSNPITGENAKKNGGYLASSSTLRDTIELIGEWHNESLDTIFSRLERVKDGDTAGIGDDTWQTYIKEEMVEFANSKGLPGDSVDISELDVDTYRTIDDLIAEEELSTEAESLLEALDDALDLFCLDENYSAFESTCDSIITQALNLNDEIEALAVGCGASVGKNSAEYWTDQSNLQRLADLCAPREKNKPKYSEITGLNDKQKRILQSDAEGAVGGAIAGGQAGLAAGGPVGAAALGAATACIWGGAKSCARAIVEEAGGLPWWADWIV